MTPEDIGNLTLADLEAIAARFSGAVLSIREAQAMLGQVPPMRTEYRLEPALGTNRIPQQQPMHMPQNGGMPSFEPQEHLPHLEAKRREREDFLRQQREAPERQEKLKQFAHDSDAPEDLDG